MSNEQKVQTCQQCGVDHFNAMRNALMSIFDYSGNDIQAIKNTAYRALPNTECQSAHQPDVQAADAETAFQAWWATKAGDRPTTRFSFESGYAAALAASPVQQNTDASKEQNTLSEPKPTAPSHSSVVIPESVSLDADLPQSGYYLPSDVHAALLAQLKETLSPPLILEGDNAIDVASWFTERVRAVFALVGGQDSKSALRGHNED